MIFCGKDESGCSLGRSSPASDTVLATTDTEVIEERGDSSWGVSAPVDVSGVTMDAKLGSGSTGSCL